MPVIEAKWEGQCAACGMAILLGERIDYSAVKGARHLTCMQLPARIRRNLYRMTCRICQSKLKKGEGALIVTVGGPDDKFKRKYQAECVDVSACLGRAQQ